MSPAKVGKILRAVARGLVLCGLMAAGQLFFQLPASAQSCTSFQWPAITVVWQGEYDIGYRYGIQVSTACTMCCEGVSIVNEKVLYDGAEVNINSLPEGAHTITVQFTATNGSGDPNFYKEQSYTSSRQFYVDKTSPTIVISKPEDGVSITTADVAISGNIADAHAKLGGAYLELIAEDGPCRFYKDFSGTDVDLARIGVQSCYGLGLCPSIPPVAGIPLSYDLRDYTDFSHGRDCGFNFYISAGDRAGNSSTKSLRFTVDQEAPEIRISTWPVVLSSGPATLIAGTVADSSKIQYLKFSLSQLDGNATTTYWNGAAWAASPVTIEIVVPPGTKKFDWNYSVLQPKDVVSGSHYKLTVYSGDEFGHQRAVEQEFDYDACTYATQMGDENNGEDVFEVGTGVFRQLNTTPPWWLAWLQWLGITEWIANKTGHAGIYVVSDSGYAAKNGVSTVEFVSLLEGNEGKLLPVAETNGRHFIVEAMHGGVGYTSLESFKAQSNDYWGAYEGSDLQSSQREQIAYSAALQLGKPYGVGILGDWDGPERYRCDGLIVYAYKKAFRDDAVAGHNRFQFPLQLVKEWTPVTTSPPGFTSLDVISEGDKFAISAGVADAESGIDRVDYLLKNHQALGGVSLLGSVETDNLTTYASTNTCNPDRNLLARVVDRAGNWRLVDFDRSEKDKSSPLKTYSVPSISRSPERLAGPDKRFFYRLNGQNKYAWRFQDDTTPTSQLLAFYAVDISSDSWDENNVSVTAGGDSNGLFSSGPGAHTMHLAMMDEHGNFTFHNEEFTVPNITALFESAPEPAGELAALSFEDKTAPGEHSSSELAMTWPTPEGYQNSPASVAVDLQTTAQYAGAVGVQVKLAAAGMSAEDKQKLHLLHLNNGAWEDVTAGVDTVNNIIFGYSNSLSPFAVYSSPESVPNHGFPDKWPPFTKITADGPEYQAAGGVHYVSTTTLLGFDGIDDHAAAVSSYYRVGISSELITHGLRPETLGEFALFGEKFLLPEGAHLIGFGSVDAAANYGLLKTRTIKADGTAPRVELSVNGVPYAAGSAISSVVGDTISVSAEDIMSKDVASGLATTYLLINISPEECESGVLGGGVNGIGGCVNPYYAGPFTLPEGAYTIYYAAKDNVGNGVIKSVSIQVGRKMPFPRAYEFSGKFPINSGFYTTRDKDGNIYVASFREISKYSPSGAFMTKWGSSGAGPGQFSSIWGIRVGPDGNIYALDASNKNIQKFTPAGTYLSTIKIMLQYPQGFALDRNGNFYVADPGTGHLAVLSSTGAVLRNLPVSNCLDVAIDASGNVYAADNASKAIKKFSKDGNLMATYVLPANTYLPLSIEVDPYGNIYVADIGNASGSKIMVFSSSGAYIGEFGSASTTPGSALGSTIAKMELDEESGRLYIPQSNQLFVYKAVESMPAPPRIVSPTGNTGVFNNQVMVYLQAAPGQKVEVFDGDVLAASGYADNAEGEFSASLSLASGSHALSAKATSNMGVGSERTSAVNVTVQTLRSPAFSQAVSIPVRGYPYTQVIATTTVAGDFNGDHLQDIVAIGKWSYTVLLGRGDGNFDEQLSVNYESYSWGGSPGPIEVWEAAAEDVNKDGKLDFVMTSLGRVLTALGDGDGTFRLVDSGYVPSCSTQYILDTDFRVGDVNNDGYPDVVKSVRTAAASGGSCIYVLVGAGNGKFNLSSTKAGLSANGAVNLQDFDQDGALDIANGQGIFWNDGSGVFGNYLEMCPNCVKAISADINADGLWDLIYDYKYIRFNLGNGKFSRPVTWNLNWLINGTIGKPVVSDFNGDNVPDLAVGVGNTYNDQGKVFVYSGYGDGRFAVDPLILYAGNNYSQLDTLSVADFNNDTRNDIVTALHFNTQYLTPELALFYNNTMIPDMTPPAAAVITVAPDTDGGAKVAWTAPGDDGAIGKATRYELRFGQTPILDAAGFAAATAVAGLPVPKTAGVGEAVVVGGLTGGVTYYFALKAYDEIGNASNLSNSPGFFAHYVAKSTQTVDGKAEIFVISKVNPELMVVDTASGAGALMAQTARSQDLSAVSNVYKTGFGPEYDYSGVLTFRYSAAALSAQGLLEREIAIYEYFPETGWSRLDGQVLNAADRKIIAPLNSTSTTCGIFGSTPKLLSPAANAVLYSETPLFVGRICENCSLKVYESGMLKGELTAQAGGFVSGNINFPPGTHEIEAVVAKNGAPQSAGIYRKFTVKPPFELTFDAPVMISTETRYDVGSSGLGVSDFNGDKHDDLLIFGRSGYVSALGNGAGQFNFLNPVFITLNHVFRVENPDLNKDGKADIVAGNLYAGLLGAYGSGNGTFGSIISLPNNLNISDDITYGDFNKDGNVDLALVGYNPTTYTRDIALLRGQGGANFTRKYIARPVYSDGNVKFAEMDADSNTDLVNGGTVLYGDGQGNFSNVLTVDSNCMRSLVGDFNGDGNKDIACIRNYSSFVDVYASLKNRTFRKIQSLQFPTSPSDVGAVVDMNNDGLDDLVIGSYSGKLYVLTAKGDGSFADPFTVSLDSKISTVKIIKTGDFDEDGKKDLAIGHYFAPISPQAVSLVFNRSEGIDRIPPGVVSDLVVSFNGISGNLALNWTAPGDDGTRGRATGYDLRFATIPVTEANFGQAMPIAGVPAPGVSGSSESFIAGGLAAGVTYYFALKTKDEVDNISGISNSPGLFLNFIARSTSVVDGNTEVSMVSPVQPYITQVSTVSAAWIIAIGEAAGLSLTIGSGMFEILPEGDYNPPAMLTFYYSTTTLSSVGLTEDDVAVYEHFADRSWVKLDGQVNDKLNHKITVPVTRIASLFGIFGVIKDKTPPLTDFAVEGSSRPFAAGIYISATSSVSLGAYDPVVFGTSSGVAFTEFRVDASSIAPFSVYEVPFRVSTGTHTVEFRSVDKSGNIEKAHLLSVIVDGIAPDVAYGVIGKAFPGDGIVYVASGSSVTLVSTDTVSGVGRLFYTVNGATYSAGSAEAVIHLSSAGFYGIAYNAEDNVGNFGAEHAVSLYVDTAAPTTDISLSSTTGDNGWHIAPLAVAISFSDDMAGVERTYYRLDGSSFAVYAASFPIVAEGAHVLEAYSVDNVGNIGNIRAAVFRVDLSTPDVNYSLSPAPNKDGWSNGAVDVLFVGTDTVSGVSYCSSSFTVTVEGLNIPVSGYCRDYAGWSSTSSFNLNIDTTAPASIPTLAGSAGSNGWYVSPASVVLTAFDNLSGLAGLRYSLDGSSFAVYASTVVVGASGAHVFKYYATDKAGNAEAEKLAEFKVDLETPVVETVASPAPNTHGWNNSAVNVVFAGTDSVSGLAYCEPQKTFTFEGSSQAATGYCMDYAGWSSTASLVLNIDTTSPGISYTAAPAANSLGWNNGDVSVKFACADDLSGIMSCPAEISLSAEGVDISTVAKALDYAGNFAEVAVSGLKIDKTPPASSINLSGSQRNGWYSGPVTITLVSSDALSGIKEILYVLDGSTPAVYRAPLVVPGDGEHTIKYYASDNADNLEGYKFAWFRIDTAAPSLSYEQIPAQNLSGWNNSAVDINFVGTDTMSGIDACSSGTVTLEGRGMLIPGWCRDLAGNVAYATATVNIDLTRPGLAASAEPQPNAAGWNNSDVRINYVCEDGLSGVSACPLDVVLSGEGVGISTQAVAYDHAGNASLALTSTVKIDRTAPVSAVELSGVLRNGWYSGPVGLVIKSTDALAGVKEIRYTLDTNAPAVYAGPVLVPGEGAHTLKYYGIDNADNVEDPRTVEFRIDSSSPAVSYTHTPQANVAGWNNTVVTVAFSGDDGLSGIEACSSATVAMEGRGVAVPGWCRDLAGNVADATAAFNIDLTPAAIKISSPLAGQTYIATRGNIGVDFSIKDNLDPSPSAEAYLVQMEDKGSPRGARSAKIAVAAGQSIEPLDIDDGLWRLEVSAADAAGNISSLEGGTFEVIHDMVPPRSSLSQTGPAYRPAGTNYLTSAAVFTVSSLDDLVAAGDGLGLGVVSQGVKVSAGAVLLKEFAFVNARPAQGEAVVSTFGFAGLPDGFYDLSYSARDLLNNVEPAKEWTFALDNTPPVTQYNMSGVAYEAGGKIYMNSTASIGLAGVDVSSGGVASGLMVVKLRLDDAAWGVYSSTFSFEVPGEHLIEYQSMDNVQNAEAVRRLTVVIDNTAPSAQAAVGEPQYEVFGLRIITPETPVTLSAADQGEAGLASGIKGIYYELLDASGGSTGVRGYTEPIKIGTAGTYVLRYWAVDNAGNRGAPQEQRLMVSSLQGDALDAVNGLDMSGSADIAGAVKSNGVVSLGGSARILGDVSASTITVSGNAKITGQRFSGVAPLVSAPLYMPVFVEIASNTNSNVLIPAKYLVGGKLVMDAKAELTLSTGVYYFSGIDLKGGASVVLNGKVDILVAGDVSIAGGSSFNAAGPSVKLNIFLSTASSLSFAGGGNLAAYVYAPYADLKLTGNALLGGHYFVKNAFVSGNGNILQAGESLPAAVPSGGGGGKKVSAMAAQDGSFGVLAGPSAEFRLGEVYVFPNPALRGAAPTLHVEVGIADRVKITIYTVSGRQAHEIVLTGIPAALDDGNGLSYAYEYTWRDSIPSGVYFYHIEAEKNGQKIKKSGKFGVVR